MLTKESIPSSETTGCGVAPQNDERPPMITSSSAIAMDTPYAQRQQQKESTDNNGSDADDDDAVGAMIYNASRTAKLRAAAAAEEVPSSNEQKETDDKKEKVKADSSTLKKKPSIKRARISVADRARMLINNTTGSDDSDHDSRDISPGIPSQITAARKQVKQSQKKLPSIVHKDVPPAQPTIHEKKEDVPPPPIVLNDGTIFQFNSAEDDEDMKLEIPKKEGVTFPYKLYNILETKDEQINQAIRWQPREGTAFIIHDNDMFVKHVLPKFSKATQLRSFHRQLYLWGFSRLIENSNIWYHPSFKRGQREKLVNITRTDSSYSKTAGPTARTSPSTTIAIDAMNSMLAANYSMKEAQPPPTTTNIIKPNNEMIISEYDNYYYQYLSNMGLRDRILATLQYSAAMSSVRVTTTNDYKDETAPAANKVRHSAKDGNKDNNNEVVELDDEESTSTTPINDEEEEEEDTQQVIVWGGLISLPRSYVQEKKDVCIPNAAWRKKIRDGAKKVINDEEDGKQCPIRDDEPLRKPTLVEQISDQLTREQVADQRLIQLNQLMRENVMLQKEAMLQKELLEQEQDDKKKKLSASEQEIVDRRILKLALQNPQAMKDDPRLRQHVEDIALKYAQKQKALDSRQQKSTSLPVSESKSPAVAVAAMAEVHSERIDRAILASAIKHPQAIKEDPLLRQQVEAIVFKYAQKQRALDGEQSTLSLSTKSKPTQHQGPKAPDPRSVTLSKSKASDREQVIKSTRPKKRIKTSKDYPIVHIDHSKGSQPTILERSCFRHGIEDIRSGKGSNGVHATSPEEWTKEASDLDRKVRDTGGILHSSYSCPNISYIISLSTSYIVKRASSSDDIITLYNVVGTTFPTKLYGMLLLAENLAQSCISWVCNGYAVQIHDPNLFLKVIGQHFCKATRITSYGRQMRNWGFVRIPAVGEWAWYHEDFIRGHKSSISKIKTHRSEGSRETSSSPMEEVEEDEINREMQNQYPTTLSVSVSYGSPAPSGAAAEKSIAGLDQLAAAIEEEDDIDQPSTNNAAQNGDVCIKHGAKKVKANVRKRKTCSHEGCTNQSKTRGLCTRHHMQQKIQQDTLWM